MGHATEYEFPITPSSPWFKIFFHYERKNKERKENIERGKTLRHVDWSILPSVSEDVFSIPPSSSPIRLSRLFLDSLVRKIKALLSFEWSITTCTYQSARRDTNFQQECYENVRNLQLELSIWVLFDSPSYPHCDFAVWSLVTWGIASVLTEIVRF